MFKGLESLRDLYLDNKIIGRIENNAFVHLANLEVLILNSNNILSLSFGIFNELS